MTTRLWITRTRPAADRSSEAWRTAGFDPVVAPLLSVEPVEARDSVPDKADLVFTSSHAVSHSDVSKAGRRVYAVGDRTADAARTAGFSDVVSADGDWTALRRTIEASDRPIVHLSGETVQGRLVEALREEGRDARRVVVYRSVPVEAWPLDMDDVDAVALYSPLASRTLMQLPRRNLSNLTAFCLSANVAEPLRDFGRVRTAAHPSEAALIACSRPEDG